MNSPDAFGPAPLGPVKPPMSKQTKILIGVSVLLGLLLIGAIICIVVVSNKLKAAQSKAKNDIAAYDTKYKGVVSSDSECKKNLLACNNSYSSLAKSKTTVESRLTNYKSNNAAAKIAMILGIYKFTDQPDIHILFDKNNVKLLSIRAADDGKLTATTLGSSDVIYKTDAEMPIGDYLIDFSIEFKTKIDTSAFNDVGALDAGSRRFVSLPRHGSISLYDTPVSKFPVLYKNNNLTVQYQVRKTLIIN